MNETKEMMNVLEGYLNEREIITVKEYNRLLIIISNIKREIMHGPNFISITKLQEKKD